MHSKEKIKWYLHEDCSEFIHEECPHCGHESKLLNLFEPQLCQGCNETILPCSMCDLEAMDKAGAECTQCPLGGGDKHGK